MSSDAATRTGAAVLAKVQNVNKKIVAVVLAVAMVLSLFAGVGIHFATKAASTKESIPFSNNKYTVTAADEQNHKYSAGNEYYYNQGGKTYAYTFTADLIQGDVLTFDPDTKDITWERNPEKIFGEDYQYINVAPENQSDSLMTVGQDGYTLSLNEGKHLDANTTYYYIAPDDTAYAFQVDRYVGFEAANNFGSNSTQRNWHINGSSSNPKARQLFNGITLSVNPTLNQIDYSGTQLQRETIYVKKTTEGIDNDKVYLVVAELNNRFYILKYNTTTSQNPALYDVPNRITGGEACSFHNATIGSGTPHTFYPLVTSSEIDITNQVLNNSYFYDSEFEETAIDTFIFGGLPGQDGTYSQSEFLSASADDTYSYLGGNNNGTFSLTNLALGKIGHSETNSNTNPNYYKAYVYNRCDVHPNGTKWKYNGNSLEIQQNYLTSGYTTLYFTTDSSKHFTFSRVADGTTNINLYELQEVYEEVTVNSSFIGSLAPNGDVFPANEVTYSDTMTNEENGLELDKSVSKTNEDGVYKVHLEAYQKTPTLTLPETDIALVFDTSHNMNQKLYDWEYTNLETHPQFTKVAVNTLINDNLFDEDDEGPLVDAGNFLQWFLDGRKYKHNKYVEDPQMPGTYVYLHQKWNGLTGQTNHYTYWFTSYDGTIYQIADQTERITRIVASLVLGLIGIELSAFPDGMKFNKGNTSETVTIREIYTRTGTNADKALNNVLSSKGNLYIRDDYGVMRPVTVSLSDGMYTYEATDSKGQQYRFVTGNKLNGQSESNGGYGIFQGLYKVKTDNTLDIRPEARMKSKTLYALDGNGTYSRLLAEKEAAEDILYHIYDQSIRGDVNVSITNYDTAANTQYHQSLTKVTSFALIDEMIDGVYSYQASSSNASKIDAGMADAYNQLNSGLANSRKFAILFSGGVPAQYTTGFFGGDNSNGDFNTTVANAAINSAYRIKNDLKGTVYSIGMFENANPADNKMYGNKFYYGNAWLHPPVTCNGKVGSAWGRTGLANLLINGFNLSIDPMDAAATNRMLNYISSDHANATELGLDRADGFWRRLNPGRYFFTLGGAGYQVTKVANRTDENHYFGISPMDVEEVNSDDDDAEFEITTIRTAEDIQEIIDTMLQNVQAATAVPTTTLDKDSSLVDGITGYFNYYSDSTHDINYYVTTLNGNTPVTGLEGVNLVADVDGDTVTVTGFPYTQYYNQYKLVVEFYIQRRDGLIGGNSIPTNLSRSAIYDQEGVMEEQFEIPKVDLPLDMEDVEHPISKDQAVYYASDADLVETINPYWIDGSNNEFVDITYKIYQGNTLVNTYTVLAGESEGTWSSPATDENSTDNTNPLLKDTTEYRVEAYVNARNDLPPANRLEDGKIRNATYDDTATAYVFKPHFDVYNDKVLHVDDNYTVTDIPTLSWKLSDDLTEARHTLAELTEMLEENREPTVQYDVYTGDTRVATVTEETVDKEVSDGEHTVIEVVREKTLSNTETNGAYTIHDRTDFQVRNVTVTPNPVYYEREQTLAVAQYDTQGRLFSVTTYDINEVAQTPQYYDTNGNEVSTRPTGRTVDNSRTQTTRGMVTKSHVRDAVNASAPENDDVTYLNTLDNVANPTATMWEDPEGAVRDNGEYTISLNSHDVTIINHTVQYTGDPDFSDPTHPFPLTLTLKNGTTLVNNKSFEYELYDADGTKISAANASLTFTNGTATIPNPDNQGHLKDAERIVLKGIDNGYTLTLTSILGDNYSVSYQDKTDAQNPVSLDTATTDDDETSAVVTINNDKTIDVTHTVHHIVVTGQNGISGKVNPFIIAAIVVAVLGGAYVAYIVRRKSQAAE